MKPTPELTLALLVVTVAAIAAGWGLSYQLAPEGQRPQRLRELLVWSAKGLLLPLAIWTLMNLGLSWKLQPFMPQVQAAQNSGNWLPAYLRVLAVGLFVIGSFWSFVTLAWAIIQAGRKAEGGNRAQFKALCLTCLIAMAVPALVILFFGGWAMIGLAGIALLAPMAGYGAAVLRVRKPPPMYARAIARLKFGKYSEAEWEIIHELENCEDDFEGWMMLADLYANQFKDLPEAERTVLEICDLPRTTPSQISVALHRLADWHLGRSGDPAAARRALQLICDRLPGTHLARMARLRINQLPATATALREQQSGTRIPLPALGDSLAGQPAPALSEMDQRKAAEAANACVELLKHDPNNTPARERLARLFAERLGKPDRGIEQAALLLDMPDQPENRRAEWLGLIAAWHIKYRHDPQSGREVLERLVLEFPQTPQALAARRELQLMDAGSRKRT
ncbi:MAG TPA: hypothetical protein P5205_07650 [Candidatus Paceibacterota bacterium]|nr:hypothetical protein [Verrucomicrobiota bacterium]HSA10231.1 hypothetical protein [Candidatus Paceibacterota bacterium]